MKNSTNNANPTPTATAKFTVHTLSLDNRKNLTMTGTEKVESSTSTLIVVTTCQGRIEITGNELKINRFDNQSGEIAISGNVNAVNYTAQKQPLLKRIFK